MSALIVTTARDMDAWQQGRFSLVRRELAKTRNGQRVVAPIRGYVYLLPAHVKTGAGETPVPSPWIIHRVLRNQKSSWDVDHLPTGLSLREQIPSLDAAKSLVLSLEHSTATQAWNLPHLAAGDITSPEAREELRSLWAIITEWRRELPSRKQTS